MIPMEPAARASCRTEAAGKFPDTKAGRAASDAHVEARWAGERVSMMMKSKWNHIFNKKAGIPSAHWVSLI